MKITALKPVVARYGHRNIFLVKVETDAGIHGWGEGGISGRELAMGAIVDSFAPLLVGEDPRRIDHLWQVMFRGGFFEAGTVMSGAISAVDLALWDILGKHLNVPCWQLLGGQSRDRVECYKGCNVDMVEDLASAGWRHLRLGADAPHGNESFDPQAAVRHSVEMMHRAREIAGPEMNLCIDFHTRFTPVQAAQACEGLASMQPFFVEDPLRSPSPANYVAFRKRTNVPLAVGEECSSKWEFQPLIEQDTIDYARIDLCNIGGLTEARKVAAMAEAHYIEVVPHNPLGPISSAACVHLAVGIPNFAVLEYGPGPDQTPEVFDFQFEFKTPCYQIPQTPGLGVDVREEALSGAAPVAWTAPQRRRPDGSFTNW